MLSPKIHSTHMLAVRCSHPPCRNMEVNSGTIAGCHGPPLNRLLRLAGTMPNWKRNWFRLCGASSSSNRKTTMLVASKKYVTYGVVERGASSRMGIIRARDLFDRTGKNEDNRCRA